MRVAIISGVTGQDGSFLAELLLKKEYKVIGLIPWDRDTDFFRLKYLRIEEKITFKKIDLMRVEQIESLLEDSKPDEFYNLAALSSVGLSFQQPHLSFDFNTRSVINILESLRKVAPKTRFYQASSSEMFGNIGVDRLPVKESFLFHPASPYGISKAAAHWLTVNYREAYKLKACCGILFNHESALRPPNFVIKKIIRTALHIKDGKQGNLVLGNISIARDWGYAPRYVDAMWRMLQKEKLEDYLICSGAAVKLKDFVSQVFSQLNLDANDYITIDKALLRSLDLEIIYGDNTKAKIDLDWQYDITMPELIRRLIADESELIRWESLSSRP